MIVLNVGGGGRYLPSHFEGWDQHLLDIDEQVKPDICCDGVHLRGMTEHFGKYDAVYCSHNLEHYYKHDVSKVLQGFWNVLKRGGFVEIHVPNIKNLMQSMASLDLHDVWYRLSDGSPVTFHDVLYGWNKAMENGNLFYAHKCGFTPISMYSALEQSGFKNIQVIDQGSNLYAKAEKG